MDHLAKVTRPLQLRGNIRRPSHCEQGRELPGFALLLSARVSGDTMDLRRNDSIYFRNFFSEVMRTCASDTCIWGWRSDQDLILCGRRLVIGSIAIDS